MVIMYENHLQTGYIMYPTMGYYYQCLKTKPHLGRIHWHVITSKMCDIKSERTEPFVSQAYTDTSVFVVFRIVIRRADTKVEWQYNIANRDDGLSGVVYINGGGGM